jgi:hypothetical protein
MTSRTEKLTCRNYWALAKVRMGPDCSTGSHERVQARKLVLQAGHRRLIRSRASLEANTPEMNMCWSFISQAGNKGTTAKAIRMKIGPDRITPTAVRRALDALVRAQQIKIFKSIQVSSRLLSRSSRPADQQHPTMQLYVLADTTPDEGMTGGIWYDGNKEYDSAFVTGITKVLLTHVRTKVCGNHIPCLSCSKLIPVMGDE